MSEELKPCPFCGLGESIVEAWQDDYGYWRVSCGRCGSSTGTVPGKPTKANLERWPDPKASAIASWNRRPDTSNTLIEEQAARIEEAEKDYHEERKARYAAQSELVISQARLSEAVKVLESMTLVVYDTTDYLHDERDFFIKEEVDKAIRSKVQAFIATLGGEKE